MDLDSERAFELDPGVVSGHDRKAEPPPERQARAIPQAEALLSRGNSHFSDHDCVFRSERLHVKKTTQDALCLEVGRDIARIGPPFGDLR